MIRLSAAQVAREWYGAAEGFPKLVARAAKKAAREAEREAKRHAPGGIKRTVTGTPTDAGFVIESDHHAAVFVEEGTLPHVIEAGAAGVLVFKLGRRTIFARRVNHPGTKAHPFLEPGLEHGELAFESFAEAMLADL